MSGADIVIGILLGLAVNECWELSSWLARKLMRWSAYRRYTDCDRAATRAEELAAFIEERPGKLFKLLTALGFAGAAVAVTVRRKLAKGSRGVATTFRSSAFGLALGLSFGLVFGLGVGLAAVLVAGLGAVLAAVLGVGLAAGLGVGLAAVLAAVLAAGLGAGLGAVLGVGLSFGWDVGLSFGWDVGLSFGLDVGLAAVLGAGLSFGLHWAFSKLRRAR